MDTLEQNPVHKDDYAPEALEPSPIQEEYAPVIFAQDTISHVISVDMLSGKVGFCDKILVKFCVEQIYQLNWHTSWIFEPYIVIHYALEKYFCRQIYISSQIVTAPNKE